MKLKYNAAPNYRCELSTKRIMNELLIGLLVVYAFSLYYYSTLGSAYLVQALLIMVVSVVSCVATEVVWALVTKKNVKEFLSSSFPYITGVILALMVPIQTSLYAILISSVLCILFGKLVFGGFGQNIFNPAAFGRAIIFAAFAGLTTKTVDIVTSVTPTTLMASTYHWFVTDSALVSELMEAVGGLSNLAVGMYSGALGETSAILIAIVAVVLALRKVIDWRIPVVYVGGVFVITAIMALVFGMGMWYPFYHILTGGLMFGAVFMATDPVTSPTSATGRTIFALGCAILTVLIRVKANLPEGVLYSILIMNALTPMIERFCDCEQVAGAKKALMSFIGVGVVGCGACLLALSTVTPASASAAPAGKTLNADSSEVTASTATIVSNENGVVTVDVDSYMGVNQFEITIADGAVESVKVNSIGDTPGYGDLIDNEDFLSQFVGATEGNVSVDAVSGATMSSGSAVQAVITALSPADTAEPTEPETTEPEITEAGIISNENGVYTVAVNGGFNTADFNVFEITVADNAIASVSVVEINDTAGIGDSIDNEEYLGQFAGLNSSDFTVDVQSGATMSSGSCEEAVRLVLEDLGL